MNDTSYDVIILPGGGVDTDGNLDSVTIPRLDRAAHLYATGKTRAIIVCGSHSYKWKGKPILTEAQVYASYLQDRGVPSEALFLEVESQESLGNLLFAKMHIIMQHDWHSLLVIPTYKQSTERVAYLLQKIFAEAYSWNILRVGESADPANIEREAKALRITKDINDQFTDGDHEAIYAGLLETHPAYGGTKWTIEELSREMKG